MITALYEHKSGDSRMPEMDDMVVVAPDLRMTADLDALAEAARQYSCGQLEQRSSTALWIGPSLSSDLSLSLSRCTHTHRTSLK